MSDRAEALRLAKRCPFCGSSPEAKPHNNCGCSNADCPASFVTMSLANWNCRDKFAGKDGVSKDIPPCLIWPDDERVAQLLDDSSGIWHGNEFRIHADELSRILRELLYRQPIAPEPISWSEEKCGRCEKTVMFRLNVSASPSLPRSGDD